MNKVLFRLLGELVYQFGALPFSRGHWRLVEWLQHHEPNAIGEFPIMRDGVRWLCNLQFGFYDRDLFYRGAYEPESIQCVLLHLHPVDVAIDVGANIGYFSLMMAKTVGANGNVFAFEPSM